MKSKVMVLQKFNEPLQMQLVEIPEIEEGQILVKIEAAGVCGSDVHMWKGEDLRTPLPIVLGHEGVGEIVKIGGQRRCIEGQVLKIGDRILWNRGVTCGRCYECKVLNDPSICTNRKVYGINRGFSEEPHLNGCYSEYIILTPNTDVFVIEDDIDPAILVSASCSGATIAHAYDMVKINPGNSILIQGPGPLGMYAVCFAKRMGASQIIVIGGSTSRLSLCKELGATTILNRKTLSKEERKKRVQELTHGRGVDVVVEAVGAQGVVEEGIQLLRSSGTYLTTGYAQPAGKESIDFFKDVVRKNIRIQGVWVSDTRHTYQALQLVLENKALFKKMITHKYKLEEANEAILAMDRKEASKAVLLP